MSADASERLPEPEIPKTPDNDSSQGDDEPGHTTMEDIDSADPSRDGTEGERASDGAPEDLEAPVDGDQGAGMPGAEVDGDGAPEESAEPIDNGSSDHDESGHATAGDMDAIGDDYNDAHSTSADLMTSPEVADYRDASQLPEEPDETDEWAEYDGSEDDQQGVLDSDDADSTFDGADGMPDEGELMEPEQPEDGSDGSADAVAGRSESVTPREFANNEEGAEYGRETWKDAQERLTPEQYEALHGYTDEKIPGDDGPPDYKEVNGRLRGYAESSPEVEDSIARIDEALGIQPIPESVKVLRETGLDSFNCPVDELPGSIQQDLGYLSTALGPEPTFAPEKEVVLYLDVPEGTPAMYMEGLSYYDSERELLLGRGAEYKVDGIERDGNRWHVYGHVLPEMNDRGEL